MFGNTLKYAGIGLIIGIIFALPILVGLVIVRGTEPYGDNDITSTGTLYNDDYGYVYTYYSEGPFNIREVLLSIAVNCIGLIRSIITGIMVFIVAIVFLVAVLSD